MKLLLESINRGILKGLQEHNIELLADLDDELDLMDSIYAKSVNNKIDSYILSIKQLLINAILTGKLSSRLKQTINDPNNFSRLKGLITANDKDHLKELIEIGQYLFGNDGNFNWIDTSEITDMSYLFFKNRKFNGHIELWDVSNVTNMCAMFSGATKFNQPIGDWDVSNITTMKTMFIDANEFNQPIGDWDVSNVTDMSWMFCRVKNFNQPIGDWDISKVIDMKYMFTHAKSFNQPLQNWTIRRTVSTAYMFGWCPIKKEYKPKFIK